IEPNADRTHLSSEKLPIELLNYDELISFVSNSDFETIIKPNLINPNLNLTELKNKITKDKKTWQQHIPFLNEIAKNTISLRKIVSTSQTTTYTRS
ncbi:MAG: hypothetical protein Q4C75_06080, partial [Bergeyella zoohelcum]|nr:hypothetical protein [Bergeyella zoohelcum]